jgi:uncharacterized Tic20 family protein
MEETVPAYHPLPQPEELSRKEKDDAMGGYLMMFAALGAGLPLPIINLIASIIYYYTNKSNSRFVRFHTLQALLSQIPLTLANGVCVFWGIRIALTTTWHLNEFFIGYACMLAVANILYLVFGIISAIKANKGRMYYYWFFGHYAYEKVFLVRAEEPNQAPVNLPPRT